MKNLLLFCLLLLSGIAFAQAPFAKPGASWCIATMYPTGTTYSEPKTATDSVLQGRSCSFVNGVGGLFVNNDTVYRILGDGSIRFLYDYKAHAGDTWKIFMPNAPFVSSPDTSIKVHVDSVDQVDVRGTMLRRIFTSVIDTPFTHYGYTLGTVLEGVGTNYYFLPGPWGLVDDGIPSLSCFRDSTVGAIWFREDVLLLDSCNCHVWMGSPSIMPESKGLLGFSPATGNLHWNLPEQATQSRLQIFTTAGAEIFSQQIFSQQGSVSVANLPAGMYICQVRDNRGILLTTKFAIAN
jgi:hypothetical protein